MKICTACYNLDKIVVSGVQDDLCPAHQNQLDTALAFVTGIFKSSTYPLDGNYKDEDIIRCITPQSVKDQYQK